MTGSPPDGLYDFNPPAPCGAGRFKLCESLPGFLYFNPPAPCGAGRFMFAALLAAGKISIHPPRAGRDPIPKFFGRRPNISIHPPRAGRDDCTVRAICKATDFNPPAPCGAGPRATNRNPARIGISIHPPRAGRDKDNGQANSERSISIHPPRAGRDAQAKAKNYPAMISIHPPRAGRDVKPTPGHGGPI